MFNKMKKWIKLLIVFFVFMWVCTIVSKSIYVSKLAQVKTEKPSKRYIEHVVEADGMVEAGAEQAVNILSGLRVSEICIHEGDYVENGNILFRIDLSDLADLIEEKEAELKKLQYQLADTQYNKSLESQKKENELLWAKEDYKISDEQTATTVSRGEELLREAENNLKKHMETPASCTSDDERKKEWNAYYDWENKYCDAQDSKKKKERELEELEAKLTDADKLSEGDAREIKERIDKMEKELISINDEVASLEQNKVNMPDYSAEESEYDAWQEKKISLEEAVNSAKQAFEEAKINRTDELREKSRATALAEVLSPSDSTENVQKIEIDSIQKELLELYAVQSQRGEVKADKSGYVLNVQVEVGNRTSDTAAIILADENEPYQFRFSITKEQGKYLHLDDKIELEIKDKGSEVNVDYMEGNSAGGYDITCKLSEAIEKPGISGNIRKVEQGELHSVTVPAEAIHEESKNYFIYVLKEKMGILGKEYYAEKIKVSILDQNDTFVALKEGSIGADMDVITSYSKEIEQGDIVRLTEE